MSSKIYLYFPALCSEHAVLAFEVLRLSALSIADAVTFVMRCGVRLPCRSYFCVGCAAFPGAVNVETTAQALRYVWPLHHAAVVVFFLVLVLLGRSRCGAVYPGTVHVQTTSTSNCVPGIPCTTDQVAGTTVHVAPL